MLIMKSIHHKLYPKYIFCLAAIIISLAFLIVPLYGQVAAQPTDMLYVTFIDVGQGDSSLLRTSNGINILIDAGPTSAGQTVLSYLNGQSVTSLDVIVMSHNHEDHIGGLITILQSEIQAGNVLYNGNSCTTVTCQNVWAAMANRGIVPSTARAGDSYIWDTLTTTILNPQHAPTGDENEDSIVMNVSFYDHRLLFTGDIGFSTETLLVNQGGLSSVDVLKVAHHGSAYSTSTEFLSAVNPQNAVISVGANNTYGHPNSDTLNRLVASGAYLYRTDFDGNVTFSFTATTQEEPFIRLTYLPLVLLESSTTPPPPPPPPNPMPGENVQCNISGQVEICASVSNASPPRYSYVTVYGRLLINGTPQSGKPMSTSWFYKTTTSYCNDGITGLDGLASCQRYIGGASAGYQVNISVSIDGYSVTTSFTPVN
jgi:beta-lactamase superfamily II metal-dependent hydrolase